MIGVTGVIAADADARVCLYVAAGWAVALGIGWTVLKKGNPAIADRDESWLEKVGRPPRRTPAHGEHSWRSPPPPAQGVRHPGRSVPPLGTERPVCLS